MFCVNDSWVKNFCLVYWHPYFLLNVQVISLLPLFLHYLSLFFLCSACICCSCCSSPPPPPPPPPPEKPPPPTCPMVCLPCCPCVKPCPCRPCLHRPIHRPCYPPCRLPAPPIQGPLHAPCIPAPPVMGPCHPPCLPKLMPPIRPPPEPLPPIIPNRPIVVDHPLRGPPIFIGESVAKHSGYQNKIVWLKSSVNLPALKSLLPYYNKSVTNCCRRTTFILCRRKYDPVRVQESRC